MEDKYCQSCIERYKITKPATRVWAENYFICDDCFQPLVNNILGIPTDNDVSSKPLNGDSPLVNQIYDLLEVPEHLRSYRQDTFLKTYTDLFNYQSTLISNMELKDLVRKLEEYRLLFSVIKKGYVDAYVSKIDSLKRESREKLGVTGEEKSRKEASKVKPSKVKLSQQESLAKRLGISVEDLQKAQTLAKKEQSGVNEDKFNTMIGKEVNNICKKAYMKDGKPSLCKLEKGHEGNHD
jgi:hypothetical protein